MTVLKDLIAAELTNAPATWLTAEQLAARIPAAKQRISTVTRALRKLRAEGNVTSQVVAGDPKLRKQWSFVVGSVPVSRRRAAKRSARTSVQARALNLTHQTRSLPMATFEAAVETIINEFVTGQKTFSAFDVTQELRTRSNAGTVVIDKAETGTVHVSGADTPKIEHDEVKRAVVDLFGAGKLAGYDRTHNGTYWQYGPAAAAPVDPSAAASGNGSPPPVSGSSYDGSSSL